MYDDEPSWLACDPEDLWIYDKLILARKLGYQCGPIGVSVPKPGPYIVRPCVNLMGMGRGARKIWIDKETDDLPIGHFWCEIFSGRHLSVDYVEGKQVLCVEGFNPPFEPLYRWDRWIKVNDQVPYPSLFKQFPYVNCEFIGGKLIEAHLRHNPDFQCGAEIMIPVWKGESTSPPKGMRFIKSEDFIRLGFFVPLE